MPPEQITPTIHLPRLWKRRVKSAVLQVISLAHFAIVNARGRAVTNAETSAAAESNRLHHVIALLREELRIKDARMIRVDSQRRPHYTPFERMAVLELRADRLVACLGRSLDDLPDEDCLYNYYGPDPDPHTTPPHVFFSVTCESYLTDVIGFAEQGAFSIEVAEPI